VTSERASRWRVGAVAAAALVALGLLYASPLLLAATAVPLGYVCYGALSTVSTDAAVAVERSVDDTTPPPGETVTVTLSVENVSETTLPDVRVVDGVPDDLAVVDGSPRTCVALRPGESATLTYDVVAKRGDFAFADPVVRLRSFSAGRIRTEVVPATGDTELSALDPVAAAPVGSTLVRAGTHPTDSGGEGLEFHSTREYRPGDSISRIHWRRFAKTGDLTTVSFREERSVRVVVVVDARTPGRVRPHAGAPTAASLAGYAGQRLYETLVAADVTTGAAAFGVDGADPSVPTGAGPVPWVSGDRQNATAVARSLFDAVQRVADDPAEEGRDTTKASGAEIDASSAPATTDGSTVGQADGADTADTVDPADASDSVGADHPETATPDGGVDEVGVLLSQFPPNARVLFVTPMLDEWPVEFVSRARRREYPVTVCSPDATDSDSLARTVAGHERDVRLSDAAATGATVVDWDRSDSVEAALAETLSTSTGGQHG